MKRDKPKKQIVWPCWKAFKWLDCESCKKQFRREVGWEFKPRAGTGTLVPNNFFLDRYVCSTCAPRREDAEKFALSWKDERYPPMSFMKGKEK